MDPRLKEIWNQARWPVIVRGGRVRPLIVKLPDGRHQDHWDWLHEGRDLQLTYHLVEHLHRWRCWSIPQSWFEITLKRALARYGAVYVVQPYRRTEKCTAACQRALGAICECSCLGQNHGAAAAAGRWHIVDETLAVRVDEREFSCRLLRPA